MLKWDKRLIQLRDALAMMVPFPHTALALLEEAGIDYGLINFDGGPLVMWNNILRYVNNNEQVNDLVATSLGRYPNNPYLLAFQKADLQDYTLGADINSVPWKSKLDNETKEKIMGATSTLLPIRFLALGLDIARAVARVVISRDGKKELGSGFLTDNNIFITNHHVLPDLESAAIARVEFNYEESPDGLPLEPVTYQLDPDAFFKTSLAHDFTAVRLQGEANKDFGSIPLKKNKVTKGDFVNIIQHPGGGYKQIGLYHNIVSFTDELIIQYLTDTEPGSSGSPVFNSRWEVVAVHHTGGLLAEPGVPYKLLRNEGIAINQIIDALA